jgi:hypothetical protein
MLSGGHQQDKNAFFVNKPKISCLPKAYLLFLIYEEYESWMRRKSQSCMTESFLIRRKLLPHRKCFLIYDEFAPKLIPSASCTLNVRKNISTLYFYNI